MIHAAPPTIPAETESPQDHEEPTDVEPSTSPESSQNSADLRQSSVLDHSTAPDHGTPTQRLDLQSRHQQTKLPRALERLRPYNEPGAKEDTQPMRRRTRPVHGDIVHN